jgi:hypothetical protein
MACASEANLAERQFRRLQTILNNLNSLKFRFGTHRPTVSKGNNNNNNNNNNTKYRPITCLCTIYKIYTACIAEKIYKHLEINQLLAEEQKRCIKNSQGCKEQLIVDSIIMEQAHKDNRSLYIAYIDYRKAIDSVPHNWLIRVLEIYKIDPMIINSLQQSMKKWTTLLRVKVNNDQITSDPIRIQRGIYQGESFSPLWFCPALNPLFCLLNRKNYGFGINSNNQEMQRLTHLLCMDDIKLYAATDNQLQGLLQLIQTFSRDIKMSFEIQNCKTLSTAKGKIEMKNFTTEDEDTMEAMNEDDIYRYLGHMQTKQIKHAQMKRQLGEEYLHRTKSI